MTTLPKRSFKFSIRINEKTGKNFDVMGLKNKSAGFSKSTDNLPPNSKEISKKLKK